MKKINVHVRGGVRGRDVTTGRARSATGTATVTDTENSYGFRMSKKVAELTQVVHMLFVRNHEKEIENEALRVAYEDEIAEVIADAKSRLLALETDKRAQASRHAEETALCERRLVDAREQSSAECRDRVTTLESELRDVKSECGNVRDLLINAQKDIERLKHGHLIELSAKQQDIDARQNEISRMKSYISRLEQNTRGADNEAQRMRDIIKSNKHLSAKIADLQTQVDGLRREKQQLIASNRLLEAENNKPRPVVQPPTGSSMARPEFSGVPIAVFMDCKEETKRLREQVAKFRMELSNRESNFNRMFTEKQPIVVDHGGGARFAAIRQRRSLPDMGYRRPPRRQSWASSTASLQSGADSDVDEDRIVELSSAPASAANTSLSICVSSGRCLPHLSADSAKARPPRLLKPRPPRELISAKARAWLIIEHNATTRPFGVKH
ncbi:hypothetical protein NP493_313g05015 [Ridgeia piscesae]|uniref:Uncharacterized protein n=1 Tax=Ridgeia piscesae TaxID=27915 RepID=A0AAD9NWE6_RIDPI|nr:hypothetical protein NP493_313g05015 [Ridgeia piscesae]